MGGLPPTSRPETIIRPELVAKYPDQEPHATGGQQPQPHSSRTGGPPSVNPSRMDRLLGAGWKVSRPVIFLGRARLARGYGFVLMLNNVVLLG